MDYSFTEEQDELRSMLRSMTGKLATSEKVRAAIESEPRVDDKLWGQLTSELGLTALCVPEEQDGAGAGFVEVAVVLEELGACLAPVPYLPTVVVAQALRMCPQSTARDAALGEIAAGAAACLAVLDDPQGAPESLTGGASHVIGAAQAGIFLVVDGDRLLLARAGDGVQVQTLTPMDQTRTIGHVRFDGARVHALTDASETASDVVDVMRAALAVEAVGAAQRCLDITVEYLKGRVQFGRPIGQFQALKHRCADLVVLVEAARTAAYHAAWCVEADREEMRIQAPLAKAVAAQALRAVSGDSIQLHGGVGFTWEYDPHLYFKRSKTTELLFGNDRVNRRLVAARAGL